MISLLSLDGSEIGVGVWTAVLAGSAVTIKTKASSLPLHTMAFHPRFEMTWSMPGCVESFGDASSES